MPPRAARWTVDAHEVDEIVAGWRVASCGPGETVGPAADWVAASVPGTVAAALRAAGRWTEGEPTDSDARDWWFQTDLELDPARDGEELVLEIDGVATVHEVHLDGTLIGGGTSMFAATEIDLAPHVSASAIHTLSIRCAALAPLLATPRRPRQRWRQRLVDGGLRFHRTMLLGRAPGFAPTPPAIGPWRPVRIVRRRRVRVDQAALRVTCCDGTGNVSVQLTCASLAGAAIRGARLFVDGPGGRHEAPMTLDGGRLTCDLAIGDPALWWPHTHGTPALYALWVDVSLDGADAVRIDGGRVGFRTLRAGPTSDHDVVAHGLDLHINDVPIFARGALWGPLDLADPHASPGALRAALEQARDAGMNLLRIPGTAAYESDAFHALCDELGILVWQDMMFANLDYPIEDPTFRATVEAELVEQTGRLTGHPSTVVVCGNSEIEQQVAMLGLDPALGRGELFAEMVPSAVAGAGVDAVYVPSSPCGVGLPFHPGSGIAHYFGVGGYRRPVSDARHASVRFAAECLAFANVGDHEAPDAHVARDNGADWDFADVRDHYLAERYGGDPGVLREGDPERYWALSRQITGETMAATLGEWRRRGSGCHGALILSLRDCLPGSGWGLVDSRGRAKAALAFVRRANAPIAVWTVDEGLGGVAVHAANDGPEPLHATLRVATYLDGRPVLAGEEAVTIGPHDQLTRDAETLLGRFADVSWAYRFGPPQQDVLFATLERDGAVLSQATFFPGGPPMVTRSAGELGLRAAVAPQAERAVVRLAATATVWGARIDAPGWEPDDDAFDLEPGRERAIALRRGRQASEAPQPVSIRALNLSGGVLVGEGALLPPARDEERPG